MATTDPGDDRDLDAWLDGLAGRSPRGEDDPELQVLRQAVLARARASLPEPDTAADAAAWERLRFRLRREGLASSRMPARRWVPAAAAAVLVLGVAVTFWTGRSDDELQQVAVVEDMAPVFRGGPEPIAATFADPTLEARRVAVALKRVQVQATVYVQPGQAVVDFEVDPAAVAVVEAAVRKQVPGATLRPGVNRLVFRKG